MLLLTNTAARIPVGPLLAESNAKDPQTGLTVTALSVQMYRVSTSGGAVVRTQFAPTASGGDNDMILVPSSTDGMYDLELTAGNLNWLGNGRITVLNTAAILVWFMDFQVVSLQFWNLMFGATPLDVALTTASREAVADTLLNRHVEGGNNNGRLVKEALYPLRNRNELVGGTQNVYRADDTTIAWSATVATDSGALPVTGVNPAS
jgi:hypothetical protein